MIRSIAPETEISDISHLIAPFGVREGAGVLAESVGWFLQSIHLAVIDPGVGSSRRALILATPDGSYLVGPDNGLLLPSAARLGGVEGAWAIHNPALGLPERSSTFHGRDIFAPAAAHLARGVSPLEFGPAVDPGSLVRLPEVGVQVLGDRVRAQIVHIDRFGNLQTSMTRSHLAGLGAEPGSVMALQISGRTFKVAMREAYSFGEAGELQLVEDSHGSLALCENRGSAAQVLGIQKTGVEFVLGRLGPGGLLGED